MFVSDIPVDGPEVCCWIGLELLRVPVGYRFFQPEASQS